MQTELLMWLQESGTPLLDSFFWGITLLGSDGVYLAFIAWLYWCVDQREGVKWACLILTSALLNGFVKLTFNAPRPFEVNQRILPLGTDTATGHSFPSGHSQASAVFGGSLFFNYRQPWVKAAGLGFFLLIGASRVYMRVHWPLDVLAGWALGLTAAYVFHRLYDGRERLFRLLALGFWGVCLLYAKDADQIKLLGLAVAAYGGMYIGTDVLKLPVHPFGSGGRRKLALGLLLVLGVQLGLKALIPEALNGLRYGLVGLTLALLYPWLFHKCFKPREGR